MRMSMSSRQLVFSLAPDQRTITVATSNTDDEPVVLTRWVAASDLERDDFVTACEQWSVATDDAAVNALREAAGVFPMRLVAHWCAGWNEPGYLPEPPEIVQHGGSLDDNIEYLTIEMQNHQDHAINTGNPELAKDFDAALADIAAINTDELTTDALFGRRDKGHWDVLVGGTAYWIMPCHTVDCDQIMTNE